MASTGIRELKNNLSRYIRRIEAGELISITAHGRVVAKLVPPGAKTRGTRAKLVGEPPPLMTIVTRDDVRENAVALGYAVA